MIFLKPFERLWIRWHTRRMSELGLELREALLKDRWQMSEYRLTHEASGVALWTSNGWSHFRLHDIQKESHPNEFYKNALNVHDRIVLYKLFLQLKNKVEQLPADLALNHLRLGRIKEHGVADDATN